MIQCYDCEVPMERNESHAKTWSAIIDRDGNTFWEQLPPRSFEFWCPACSESLSREDEAIAVEFKEECRRFYAGRQPSPRSSAEA